MKAKTKPFVLLCPICGAMGYLEDGKYGIESKKDVNLTINFGYEEANIKCLKCGHTVGNLDI